MGWMFFTFAACMLFKARRAQATTLITLPSPDTTGGKPLMQALNERKTAREFSTKPLSDQILGDMLWAAWGINRPDGKRTMPTSMNRQDLELYVLRADGVWLYNAQNHSLELLLSEDVRDALRHPEVTKVAPVTLVYVADLPKIKNTLTIGMHTGSAYQNVGLYCASVGLINVVRASIDLDALTRAMHLPDDKAIQVTQTVGWSE